MSTTPAPRSLKSRSVQAAFVLLATGLCIPTSASVGGPLGVQQEVQTRSSSSDESAPQGVLIRTTVGQIGLDPNNNRVGLSLSIENVSRKPLYLALIGTDLNKIVSLSDDRATKWVVEGLSGISCLLERSEAKQGEFTLVAPGERLTLVINFRQFSGGGTPGTLFSVSAQGTYFTPSGLQNISIGLVGIKGTVPKT